MLENARRLPVRRPNRHGLNRCQFSRSNHWSRLRSCIFFGCLLLILGLGTVLVEATEKVEFVRDVRPIFAKHCYSCHGAEKQKSGLRLDVKAAALRGGQLYEAAIRPGQVAESPLIQLVTDSEVGLRMPPDGPGLSAAEIDTLKRWIAEGAVWPDGVDLVQLADPRDHWSFQPLRRPSLPSVRHATWPRQGLDHFVLARLETAGWQPSPPADRATWLRRVTLDLIGLPPTAEEMRSFLDDSDEAAWERVVDRLLQSPRYGERWAQHWLDVVRYADTHGFEVNTERPHAWPYRDYVIRAFNRDTPYDQFIREQLLGDILGEDAATGFLVTASVLLPGQIGKDEPSIRLARQDALDEIVVNISHTFLGLTVGCARCHDHKFDPISQRDYYSLQAFVAGVEYNDRELMTPEVLALRAKRVEQQRRLAEIEQHLTQFVPLAFSGSERPKVNARKNVDRFAPVLAKRLRFTIHQTNNLEPCIDELEVYDTAGRNVALASAGATVSSSGDQVSPNRHELRFVHDGQYGNSRSWMSNEVGGGWVEVTFAAPTTIDRVIWGRDRLEKFTDRLAVDYSIMVTTPSDELVTVADASDRTGFKPNPNQPPKQTRPAKMNESGEQAAIRTAAPQTDSGLDEVARKELERLQREQQELTLKLGEAEQADKVFAGTFRKPDQIHLLLRGDPEQPKDRVPPSTLSLFGERRLPLDAAESERRQVLAEWLVNPEHPLTARVIVNRIWQSHFGRGLVETSNDFGRSGQAPSHPELLDWLACQLIDANWSMKAMHREIVLSATYRQASSNLAADTAVQPATTATVDVDLAPTGGQQTAAATATATAEAGVPRPEQMDADVRLLWRYPTRRLDAETIRDSILYVSGQLNEKMYGRGFDLFDKRGGLSGFQPIERFGVEGRRRMIFAHRVRRERDAIFGAFDCPDGGQSTDRRRESTTPIQALNLMNSRFTLDQAEAFAQRVRAESGEQVERQVVRAWQVALQREPTSEEQRDAAEVVRQHGLALLGRVLFNSNEFLFLP